MTSSADAAAREFGVPASFDNHRDLIAHPDVDLVVVAVKVAHHHALITAVPRGLAGPAHNVAQVYATLATDLRDGTHAVPDFGHALDRHQLLSAIEEASRTRTAQKPAT